jgi:hypothetical protein
MATPDDFGGLSDPDLEKARESYDLLRRKLTLYFRNRRFEDTENLADEVIARAWFRLSGGSRLTSPLFHYCCGIAKNVASERRRSRKTDELNANSRVSADQTADRRLEQRILCRELLSVLTEGEARLVADYYQGGEEEPTLSDAYRRLRVFRAIEVVRKRFGGRKLPRRTNLRRKD